MGRQRSTVEYLKQLVQWAGGQAEFCRMTGVLAPNLASYLAGSKPIAWKRLHSATRSIFGEPPAFIPVLEQYSLRDHGLPTVAQISHDPGVYAFLDSARRVLYFGKATDLYAETRQTLSRRVDHIRSPTSNAALTFADVTVYLSAYTIARGDASFRHDVEALALRVLRNNTFNKNFGKFTRRT